MQRTWWLVTSATIVTGYYCPSASDGTLRDMGTGTKTKQSTTKCEPCGCFLMSTALQICTQTSCQWNIPKGYTEPFVVASLQWRHNEHDGVSNHQPHACLLNRLSRRRSKKTSKLRVTGLCAGNSPGTGEFPAQRASNAERFPFDDVIMMKKSVIYHVSCHNYITPILNWYSIIINIIDYIVGCFVLCQMTGNQIIKNMEKHSPIQLMK